MNEWLTLLQGALAGGAIGAFVSPVIAQRSDRRAARAKAREMLAEAENARRDASAAFLEILIQLRTAAMIAGAPRTVVEKYISVSQNYRQLGLDLKTGKSARIDPSKPHYWSGFLNMDAVMAASILSKVLWHPWAGRVLVGVRLRMKLWLWRRRTMLMLMRGAILDYDKTGKISDDGVVLFHYCHEHLPRYMRVIPLRSRMRQRIRNGPSASKPGATASAES
jgi:hypothetical protein